MIAIAILVAAALCFAGVQFGIWLFAAAGAVVFVLATAWWALIPRRELPRNRVRYMRLRLHLRLQPGRGHATAYELWLRWGRLAAFRSSGRSRASLGRWQRLAHPSEHSVVVGRAQYRHQLRTPLEEHILVMAPPRTRKTAWLATTIMHYPGPVVSTTTKADVFGFTSGIRAKRGPVHVFNPQGIGGVPSTIRFDPVAGCEDPATAIRRADAFVNSVSHKGVEDATFWQGTAGEFIRALFAAAALGGGDLRTVAWWAMGPPGAAARAQQILMAAGYDQWATALGQLAGEAQKTIATVKMTMSRALSFLTDPALLDSVLPAAGDGFDIGEFLRDSGTLYMIADTASETSPLAPLFACLADEIHYEAAMLGSTQPGGRLDPPFLMALDEVTQICPVPLNVWLADSGGKGIQVCAVTHGEGQLESRWEKSGARTILDTAGVKLFLPGISDPATLDMASKLCGHAAWQERGQEHDSRHDVVTPAMLRGLPPGFGLVLRGSLSPVVVKLPVAWKDREYKRARRAGTATAALTAAPPAAALAGGGLAAAGLTGHQAELGGADPFAVVETVQDELASVPDGEAFPWGGAADE